MANQGENAHHHGEYEEIQPSNVYFDERQEAWMAEYPINGKISSINLTIRANDMTIGVQKSEQININVDDDREAPPIDDGKRTYVEHWLSNPFARRAPVEELIEIGAKKLAIVKKKKYGAKPSRRSARLRQRAQGSKK